MPTITLTIPPALQKASSAACELLFGVLARTHADGLGPVSVPSVCHAAGRELVAIGLAKESTRGRFELCPDKVQLDGLGATATKVPAIGSSRVPIELKTASPAATELFDVLSRTAVDRRGPVLLPTICRKAGRELVSLGVAFERAKGCFELSQPYTVALPQ